MILAIAQKLFKSIYPLMDKEDRTSLVININYADWDEVDLLTCLEFPQFKNYNGVSTWKYKITRIYLVKEQEYPELCLTVNKI